MQHQSNATVEEDPMIYNGYERQYGAYKPHFKGKHKDYYPFEPIDYFYVFLYTLATWSIIIPIFYGCYRAGAANSKQYATVCFIGFVGFYMCMIFTMYFMGRMKSLYEKEMIQSKLRDLEKQAKEEKKVQL